MLFMERAAKSSPHHLHKKYRRMIKSHIRYRVMWIHFLLVTEVSVSVSKRYVISWVLHDDVIGWKRFPYYWLFVQGVHMSPVNSPHKGQRRGALILSLTCALNKRLSKQPWGWRFETLSRSLWRHCNISCQCEYSKNQKDWPHALNSFSSNLYGKNENKTKHCRHDWSANGWCVIWISSNNKIAKGYPTCYFR